MLKGNLKNSHWSLLGVLSIVLLVGWWGYGQSDDPVEGLIQLIDPLDEPEFYCIDVPGFNASLNLDGALTAHTCKLNQADDEMFLVDTPEAGQIYMDAYDLCMEAESAEPDSVLLLNECSDEMLQRFTITEVGEIQLAADNLLCIAVADGVGTPTGGPSHLRRDLAIQVCADTDASLIQWKTGVGTPS